MNKFRLSSFLLMLMVVGVLSACSSQTASEGEEEQVEQVTPVEVGLVTQGDLTIEKEIIGRAIPDDNGSIVPKSAGELVSLSIARGDYVKKGDVVGRIDAGNIQDNVRLQELSVQTAKKQLESAINQREQAEQALADAKQRVEQANIQNNSSDSSASFSIQNAQLQLDQAKKTAQRMETLYEEGAVSLSELENAQVQVEQAQNQLDQAKQSQNTGQSSGEVSVEQAEIGVTRAEQQLDSAQIGVEQAQLQVSQAQVQLEQTRDQIQDTAIVATSSGEVTQVNNKVGDMVSNQQPLATIVDLNPIKIQANISAENLPLFERGATIPVFVEALGKELDSTITYISPVTNDSGLYPVEASIANTDQEMKPGMMSTFRLPENTITDHILIPTAALVEESDQSFVYIVEEDRVKKTPVTVVRTQSTTTAIEADGVTADDQVVVKGQLTLADNNKITIIEEDES